MYDSGSDANGDVDNYYSGCSNTGTKANYLVSGAPVE